MWSKEEIDLLMSNIERYLKVSMHYRCITLAGGAIFELHLIIHLLCIPTQNRGIRDPAEIIFEMSKEERKDFYRSIACGLNRPLFAVYRRVLRMYDNRNHVGK